jgi:hypothetical protein
MFRYYLGLLRSAPGHVQDTWDKAVFRVGLLVGLIALLSPTFAESIKQTWKGFPWWVGVSLIGTTVVLKMAKENHVHVTDLKKRITAIEQAAPVVTVQLVDDDDRIYLDIHNSGATADFRTQLKLTGTANDPGKNVFAKWDHNMEGGELARIAKGTSERLRLAKRKIWDGAKLRYDVFWGSDFDHSQQLWSKNVSILTDPETHDWQLDMALILIAEPDFIDGPIHRTISMRGDGTVVMI